MPGYPGAQTQADSSAPMSPRRSSFHWHSPGFAPLSHLPALCGAGREPVSSGGPGPAQGPAQGLAPCEGSSAPALCWIELEDRDQRPGWVETRCWLWPQRVGLSSSSQARDSRSLHPQRSALPPRVSPPRGGRGSSAGPSPAAAHTQARAKLEPLFRCEHPSLWLWRGHRDPPKLSEPWSNSERQLLSHVRPPL